MRSWGEYLHGLNWYFTAAICRTYHLKYTIHHNLHQMLPYYGAFLFYSSDQLLSALLLVYHLLDGYFNQYSIFPVCNSMVWCDHAVWCPMWDVSTWSSVWKSESILFHMWLRVQRWWCLCQYILQVTSCWETFSDCQRDKIQQHGECVTLKIRARNPGYAVSGHLSTPLPG